MEYQTIKENGKVKFVVLLIECFETLLDRLEDESDIRVIRDAKREPLFDQEEAEEYIFMNPVKRERLERGWTQKDLADRLEVKQSTVAKWERKGAIYRKKTRQKADNFRLFAAASRSHPTYFPRASQFSIGFETAVSAGCKIAEPCRN